MAPEAQRVSAPHRVIVDTNEPNGRSTASSSIQDMLTCINPATNQVLGHVELTSKDTMTDMVQRARQAQRGWRRVDIKERARYLLQVRDHLMDQRQELIELLVQETGKARPDAVSEFFQVMEAIGYFAANAPDFLSESKLQLHLFKNKRAHIEYSAVGVVLNVSGWQTPLESSLGPTIPALLAGNAVLIKPSEWTPMIIRAVVDVIHEAGFPKNLLQVAYGYDELAESTTHHVDGVVCTATTTLGKKIGRIAGERFIPMTITLGSKNAMIVLNDADLERAANGAVWGSFHCAGQTQSSIQRIYVQEDVYDEFVDRVISLTGKLRQGVPVDYEIDIGAVALPEHLEHLEGQLEDAIQKGAKLVAGGNRLKSMNGHFFEPTIVVNVNDEMKVMQEVTYGPVMPVMRVRSPAEAIERANASAYGAGASVWTDNSEISYEIARQLDVGCVCINDVGANELAVEVPVGGTKLSGIGRRKGAEEIRQFTFPKTVSEDVFNLRKELFWYPYNEILGVAVDKAMLIFYRQGITKKITGLVSRR